MPTDLSPASAESYDSTVNAPAGGDPRTSASVRNPMQNIVNRIRFAWARLQEVVGSFLPLSSLYPIALSANASGGSPPNTFTLAGHGLNANDPVRLWSIGGSVPAPLAQFTTYYVVGGSLTSNTFQVSATSGGSAISLTSVGSGSIYAAKLSATSVSSLAERLAATSSPAGDTLIGIPNYGGASFSMNAGTLEVFLKALADGAANLGLSNIFTSNVTVNGTMTVGTAAVLPGAPLITGSPSTTRTVCTTPINEADSTRIWSPSGGLPLNAGDTVTQVLDIPEGVTLNSVSVTIYGGTHSNLPALPPSFSVRKFQISTQTDTLISGSGGTDTSASVGAYDTQHQITYSGMNAVVDRTQYIYLIEFAAENSTNSNNSSTYVGASWTGHVASIDIAG